MHLKDEPDLLPSIAHFVDQIFDHAVNPPAYIQIESMLQKQENLNRTLIKKELEFREEHKTLFDELEEEKKRIARLTDQVARLNDQIREKDLTIMHLRNELKASQKERRILEDPCLSDRVGQAAR